MKIKSGRVIYLKFIEVLEDVKKTGNKTNIDRMKINNMIKAIIRYFNFKRSAPTAIIIDDNVKPGLRQLGFLLQEEK
jgi:hypothetical protein